MLTDQQDKLNQMAPFPVAPAYSPHALMKTLRLAELPKTHVCSACNLWFVCALRVNLGRAALTSCCKLLPVDSDVFLLLYFYVLCLWVQTLVFFLCVGVHVHVYTWVHMHVLCLSPTVPSRNWLLYPVTTFIKPVKKRVIPYGWISVFFHFLL